MSIDLRNMRRDAQEGNGCSGTELRCTPGKYLGTVTEEKGLVPPRHRYVAVEDHNGENDRTK